MKMKLLTLLTMVAGYVAAAPVILQVESQTITVKGKKVPFATIVQPDGTWGYIGKQGESFNVIVKNNLNESTVLHWHGIALPNSQDGVDGMTQDAPIAPHSQMAYSFPFNEHGTYWVHSHYGLQEQIGVEAPLIVLANDDSKYQQIPIMFQDFSFKSPEEIFKSLHKNSSAPMAMHHNMAGMDMSNMDMSGHDMAGMDMSGMDMSSGDMADMPGMKMDHKSHMDLNDVKYDAYLTNYHSPDTPQITQVKAGDTVKLRFINGASASNFWINLGKLNGIVVAADGQDVKSVIGNKFPIAMGQRLDVLVKIPAKGGVFPILGQVEGLKDQTGLILTTKANTSQAIPATAKAVVPAVGYQLEKQLHPEQPIKLVASNGVTKNLTLTLNGDMMSYNWTLNNQTWPNIKPVVVNKGDLVDLTFDNQSMMSHPMHLHGYSFKVIKIDGKAVDGAMRDTVMVMPHSKVTVQFLANNPGKWMLHCHIAYHMAGGMMTYLQVNDK